MNEFTPSCPKCGTGMKEERSALERMRDILSSRPRFPQGPRDFICPKCGHRSKIFFN